jgi:glutamine cyclotransferase
VRARCGRWEAGFAALLCALGLGVASAASAGRSKISGGAARVSAIDGQAIPVLRVEVVQTYPHDPQAFTQGLEYYDGFLYESTGQTGHSSLRKVDLETGRVLQKIELSSDYFGEGLTIYRGKIYQLTWLTKVGFVYDLKSFRKLGEFHYTGEGWGLTHDASSLILSDGTNTLRYLNPESFEVERRLEVYAGTVAVTNLNELECIGDDIYANVWHANRVARIDGRSGQVRDWIDFSELAASEQKEPEGVLNGIAYDAARKRLFVTGKHWAHLFEVRIEGVTF